MISPIVITYFAIEAPRSTFWSPIGGPVKVCSQDRDHAVPKGSNFCPECGMAVIHEAAEEATPELRGFADAMGVSPLIAFEELHSGGWCWTSARDPEVSLTIGWHSIERFASADSIRGLGFQIGRETYLERTAKQLTYSLTELAPYHIALLEVAETFKLSGVPRLWIQVEIDII